MQYLMEVDLFILLNFSVQGKTLQQKAPARENTDEKDVSCPV